MRIEMKRLLSLLLALGLLLGLTACGSGPDEPETEGGKTSGTVVVPIDRDETYHYEVELAMSVDVGTNATDFYPIYTPEGIVFYMPYMPYSQTICRTNDSGSFDVLFQLPSKYENEAEEPYCWPVAFDMDEEGNSYVLYASSSMRDWELEVYDKDGALIKGGVHIEDTITDSRNDFSTRIIRFRYHDDKLYILNGNWNIQVATLDGEPLDCSNIAMHVIFDFTFDEEGMLYLTASENGRNGSYRLLKADPTDGYKTLAEQSTRNGRFQLAYGNGLLYAIDEENLYTWDGTTLTEEIAFGGAAGLTLSANTDSGLPYLCGITADADGCVYLGTFCNDVNYSYGISEEGITPYTVPFWRLYRLIPAAGALEERTYECTLTITAAYPQDFLTEAIALYQSKYPEVGFEWDLICATKDEFYMDTSGAAEKLAAKIMTGDMGDIVATGGQGLVYYDILQSDAFLDLKDRLEASEYYTDLNQATFETMTIGGTLRGLPIDTVYNILLYNEALGRANGLTVDESTTWSEILRFALDHPDIPLFGITEGFQQMMLYQILVSEMPDLIDMENKTVDLDQPWFRELMELFKAVSDQGNLAKYIPDYGYHESIERDWLLEEAAFGGRSDGQYAGYGNVQNAYQNADGGISFRPFFHGEQSRNWVGYPLVMYSINSRSEQQDDAWAFLEFLLTYPVQTQSSMAVPVTKSGEERGRKWHGVPEAVGEMLDVIENEVDYLYDMSYYKSDLGVPLTEYVEGTLTLDEALEEAEYNIWLRLNE